MSEENLELSRRKILGAATAVGVAGAGVGLGTSALFSDEEQFTNNRITTGTTNLTVQAEIVERSAALDDDPTSPPGVNIEEKVIDGSPGKGLEFTDLKPGDEFVVGFNVIVERNPMYVQLEAQNADDSEGTDPEPEPQPGPDDDTDVIGDGAGDDAGDLDNEMLVTIGHDGSDGTANNFTWDTGGLAEPSDPEFGSAGGISLSSLLSTLQNGVVYRDSSGAPLGHGSDDPALIGGGDNVTHWLYVRVPTSVGNEIQGDTVSFDLVWTGEQARNNQPPAATDTDVFDVEPFVTTPSPGTLAVEASPQSAGTTATANIPPTEVVTGSGVSLVSLDIQFQSRAAIDLTIDADADPPGDSLPEGFDGIGFFSVDNPEPANTAIERVRFGFSVDKTELEEPGRFTVLRYDDSETGWQPVSAQLVNTTPTAYHYEVLSPGFSTFAPATLLGGPNPIDGTRILLPEADARPDPEIFASFTGPDGDISASGITTDPELGPVIDLTSVNTDEYPVTVEDVFTVTNTGDEGVFFDFSTTSGDIELVVEGGSPGFFPLLEPGDSLTFSIEIEPNDPANQLWATLGVPTLFDPEEGRPIDISETGTPASGSIECANEESAPVMIEDAVAESGQNPSWLPESANTDDYHLRVPAYINIRQIGNISEEVSVLVGTTDGGGMSREVDGRVIAVIPGQEGEGTSEGDGVRFTFEPEELGEQSINKEAYLIVKSNELCNPSGVPIAGAEELNADNIGNINIEVEFEDDGRWKDIIGSTSVRSDTSYYSRGGSTIFDAQAELVDEAIRTWATQTVAAAFPIGPAQMIRGTSAAAMLTAGIWASSGNLLSIGGGDPPPLTPGAVFAEAFVQGVYSTDAEIERNNEIPFFSSELVESNAGLPDDTTIGLAGPSIYVSDDPAGSETSGEFQLTTTSNADATVVNDDLSGNGELELRVFRCNTARAELPLGERDTTLDLSFDYESRRTDSFWEKPYARVIVDDEVVFDRNDLAPNDSNPETGSTNERIEVNGDVQVEFGIEPSRFCSNFDHADTFLTISNLEVSL